MGFEMDLYWYGAPRLSVFHIDAPFHLLVALTFWKN